MRRSLDGTIGYTLQARDEEVVRVIDFLMYRSWCAIWSLRAKQQRRHEKLEEMRAVSESAWEELKAGVDTAWQDLKQAVDRAREQFK